MLGNESLSDTDDPFPRNAPKPTINNSDQFTVKPLVPEVSMIFNQPISKTPISNLLTERKFTPIIRNQQNPLPPQTTIPELSLIFEANTNSYTTAAQTHLTSQNTSQKQESPIEKHKPSLPFKSFSNFKLKYGTKLSSIENTTRKTVKFKPLENSQNCVQNIEINTEQLNVNEENFEHSNIEQETRTDFNIAEKNNSIDNTIVDKLDSLTSLVNSLFNEIKDVKNNIKELKLSIKNESQRQLNCQNCENINDKIDQIIEFNECIFKNMEILNETPQCNDKFSEVNYRENENLNVQKFKTHSTAETFNTNAERTTKTLEKLPLTSTDKMSQPTNTLKKTDFLETLPESEPVLVFNKDVNRSLAMNELALKYLTNDKYKIYINGNTAPVNLKTNFQFEQIPLNNEQEILKKSNDLSIATYDYMKKYKLITEDDKDEFIEQRNCQINTNNNDFVIDNKNLLVFQDIKKGPKLM